LTKNPHLTKFSHTLWWLLVVYINLTALFSEKFVFWLTPMHMSVKINLAQVIHRIPNLKVCNFYTPLNWPNRRLIS